MKHHHLIFFLLFIILSHVGAQEERCDFDEINDEYNRLHPEQVLLNQEFEAQLQKKIKESNLKTSITPPASKSFRIPVVFHIYGSDFSGRVVDQQKIQDALDAVNADFQGQNGEVDSLFSHVEGISDIEFYLAQIDPNGNSTNGIIYHPYEEGFGLNGSTDDAIRSYAWDNRKYMNVYIQLIIKSGSKNNSGIAWLPRDDMMEEGTARVVYNGKYLIYAPPASSLTHEFGHFLGLYHTFDNGGCTVDEGDHVDDTPATQGALGCGAQKNCFGEDVNSGNHMDYNPCENMFTQGQIQRMEGYLDHSSRVGLWQESNLQATGYGLASQPRLLMNYSQLNDSDDFKVQFFQESLANDGALRGKRRIKAQGGVSFRSDLQMQDFNVSNLPEGISALIEYETDSTITLELTGQALNHGVSDATSFQLEVLNSALTGTQAVDGLQGEFQIQYLDPYQKHYGRPTNQIYMGWSMQNEGSIALGYSSPLIGGDLNIELTNFDGDVLTLDNLYQNYEILTQPNSREIIPIGDSSEVGPHLNGVWLKRTQVNEYGPILSSPNFHLWAGTRKFAAFRVPQSQSGTYLYGWFEIYVESNNKTAHVLAYGINENSNQNISTHREETASFYLLEDRFLEDKEVEGSYTNQLRLGLKEQTFQTLGIITQQEGLSVVNLPEGLSLEIQVQDSTLAEIYLKGQANQHGWRDNRSDIRVIIPHSLLKSEYNLEDIELRLSIESFGDGFILEGTGELADTNNVNSGWINLLSSAQNLGRNFSYQAQYYPAFANETQPGFKLITWRKDAMANSDYELSVLDSLEVIDSNQVWQPGREYWSGPGQHLIDGLTYHAWRGQEKFVGIRLNRSGRYHYGWIKLKVEEDGSLVELQRYALQSKPGTGILAGTLEEPPVEPISLEVEDIKSASQIRVHQGFVEIQGAYQGIQVYNLSGQLILEPQSSRFKLPSHSVFIIQVQTLDGSMVEKQIFISDI